MCGIAGIFHRKTSKPVGRELLQRMTDSIAHRGPDGSGFFVEGSVGLGHRRLSIIDLSTGDQPMADETERYWLIFNGEIYNFLELRQELEGLGCRFRTRSDSEVILQAYRAWGTGCLERLRGMFAFAIWDRAEEQLFLARDRVGKKPLYFTEVGGRFLFASEAKALLTDPDVPRRIDLEALDDFLTYQYVPAPRTIFAGIQKLPPGHAMLVDGREIRTWRYWDLSFEPKSRKSDPEVLGDLRELLSEAVRIRMISDVPLGAFLSGGIDSSLVVALMAEQSEQPVRTFSIGFTDQSFNELPYARRVAERYGTVHEEFIVTPDLLEVFPELVWHFDEPFGDSSAIPTYYLAKMTRQRVTVALNGDGGDEGFAGYERYLGNRIVNLYRRLPEAVRRHLLRPTLGLFGDSAQRFSLVRRLRWLNEASLGEPFRQYAHSMTIFHADQRQELLSPAVKAELGRRDALDYMSAYYDDLRLENQVDRMLYSDTMTYLPGDLLVKVDRMTMRHSLEGRSPLLDHKVLEYAASLPGSQKLRGTQLKYYLKKIAEPLLPAELLHRPKQGFGVPIGRWFREDLRGWVTEMLAEPRLVRDGLLNGAAIQRVLLEHLAGSSNHSHRLWCLVNLEAWYRMFILQESAGSQNPMLAAR